MMSSNKISQARSAYSIATKTKCDTKILLKETGKQAASYVGGKIFGALNKKFDIIGKAGIRKLKFW